MTDDAGALGFLHLGIGVLVIGGSILIEHPEQAKDQVAVQTAGMLGALRVYSRLVEAFPEGRLPFLDALIKRRDGGTLEAHIRGAVEKGCK